LAGLCAFLLFIAGLHAAGATRKTYDISAGDAASTLKQFIEQSGEQVVFLVNKVRGVTTNAVHGELEARAALDRMLAGTDLYAVQDEKTHALVINRVAATDKAKSSEHTTPPETPGAPLAAMRRRGGEPDPPAIPDNQVVKLPAFTISSEKDVSYVGKESLSTTRTGVEIADLPQSVIVLNKAFFSDTNPTILAKALNYVGGAQTGTITWSVDRYMIRGFVGEGDYVDGFRTQTDKNTNFNLVDHVEIIKGPSAIFIANQGNTVGGVINKISKSPPSYKVATLSLQTGLWDGTRGELDIGGPFRPGGKLLWRLLLTGQDSKGYYDYTYEKRTSVLPMLAYKFNATTEAWIKFETFNSHYSAYNGVPLDGRTNTVAAVPIRWNLNEGTPQNWRTDRFTRLWGQFTTRPSEFLAVRIAAFDSRDTQRRVESILSPSGATTPVVGSDGIATFSPFPQYVIPPTYTAGQAIPRTVTAIDSDYQPRREVQNDYVFNFETGPVGHKLLVGGDAIDYPQNTRTYSAGSNSTASSSGIDPFNPTHPGTVFVNFNQPPSNVTARSQNFGKLYALETANLLGNRLILSVGGSRNRYALSSTSTSYNQNTGTPGTPSVVPETTLYKNLVQYGVVAKPWPTVSVFYGYNKNFSANPIQFGQFLPPQEGEQKEFGLKTELLDGRAAFSVNHFEVTQLNNSVPAFPQTTPPSNVLVPGTVSHGFDGDFSATLGRNFDVIGSFAWFKARVPLPAPWNLAPQPHDGKVYSRLPVNNVSEHNFAAWGRYKFTDSFLKGLSLGLGVSYLARRAITDNANLIFYGYVPARTVVDASIGYEMGRFHYQLNVDNLFDKKYVYASRSNQVIVPGTPTNLRFSVTYRLY
jgi:iron complex outermembrane receptor protein